MFSSPFLGTFFQLKPTKFAKLLVERFRPLSWGLSFNRYVAVFIVRDDDGFRPLSWGLSFNKYSTTTSRQVTWFVFVPFLGDFLSIVTSATVGILQTSLQFSSPFLGTFFQ